MGQRLVISVFAENSDSEPLATYYYHWSAYTITAAEEVKKLLSKIDAWETKHSTKLVDLPEKDAKLALVHIGETLNVLPDEETDDLKKEIEENQPEGVTKDAMLTIIDRRHIGGGPGSEEIERLKKLYSGEAFKHGNLDYGLVDVTFEGMHESLDWAEGDARINLIDRTFCIYCTTFTSPVEWKNGYGDWNDQKLEELPVVNYDPTVAHKFSEINKYIAELKKLPEAYYYKPADEVVQLWARSYNQTPQNDEQF